MESNPIANSKEYLELMKEEERRRGIIATRDYFARKTYKLRLRRGKFLEAREQYRKEQNDLPIEVRRYNEQLKKNN